MRDRAAAAQIAADDEAVEAMRQKFGDAEAARLAADLYKLRRSQAPTVWGFPRWVVIGIALWAAVLETVDKLPQLMLTVPRYQAALADVKVKLMQPDMTTAQLAKANNEAKASDLLPETTSVQLERNKLDVKTAAVQPDLATAQLHKAVFDAKAAEYAPQAAELQVAKTAVEMNLSKQQLPVAASKAVQAEQDAVVSAAMLSLLQNWMKTSGIDLSKLGIDPAVMATGKAVLNPQAQLGDVIGVMPRKVEPSLQSSASTPTPRPNIPAPAHQDHPKAAESAAAAAASAAASAAGYQKGVEGWRIFSGPWMKSLDKSEVNGASAALPVVGNFLFSCWTLTRLNSDEERGCEKALAKLKGLVTECACSAWDFKKGFYEEQARENAAFDAQRH